MSASLVLLQPTLVIQPGSQSAQAVSQQASGDPKVSAVFAQTARVPTPTIPQDLSLSAVDAAQEKIVDLCESWIKDKSFDPSNAKRLERLTTLCEMWASSLFKPPRSTKNFWAVVRERYDQKMPELLEALPANLRQLVKDKLEPLVKDAALTQLCNFAEDENFVDILKQFEQNWKYPFNEIFDRFQKLKTDLQEKIPKGIQEVQDVQEKTRLPKIFRRLFKGSRRTDLSSERQAAAQVRADAIKRVDAYKKCIWILNVKQKVLKIEEQPQDERYQDEFAKLCIKIAEKTIDDADTGDYCRLLPLCFKAQRELLASIVRDVDAGKVGNYIQEFEKAFYDLAMQKFCAKPQDFPDFQTFKRELDAFLREWRTETRPLFIAALRKYLISWTTKFATETEAHANSKEEAQRSPLASEQEARSFYETLERDKEQERQAFERCIGFFDQYQEITPSVVSPVFLARQSAAQVIDIPKYFADQILAPEHLVRLNIIVARWQEFYRIQDPENLGKWSPDKIVEHIRATPQSPQMIALAKAWVRANSRPSAISIEASSKVDAPTPKTPCIASKSQELTFEKTELYKKAGIASAILSTLAYIAIGLGGIFGLLPIIGWALLGLAITAFLYGTFVYLRANAGRIRELATWGHPVLYFTGLIVPPSLLIFWLVTECRKDSERSQRAYQLSLERGESFIDFSLV